MLARAALVLCLLLSAAAARGHPGSDPSSRGAGPRAMTARGVSVALETLRDVRAQAAARRGPGRAAGRFRETPAESHLPAHPRPHAAPAADDAFGALGSPGPPSPMTLQSFEGIPDDNTIIPPDPAGAVGPDHLVTMVNSAFAILDKTTGAFAFGPVSASSFWSALGEEGESPFSPRAIYDQGAGRFLLSAINVRANGDSHFLLAVSNAPDPMEGFLLFAIPADPRAAATADFPTLGVDAERVYLAANLYSPAGFVGPTLVAIDKQTLLSGDPLLYWHFDPRSGSMPGGSWQPAHSFDTGGSNYVVYNAGTSAGSSFLRILEVISASGAPALRDLGFIRVAPFGSFTLEGAPQLSSDATLDTLDTRLSNAVLRQGRLWTTHHVDGGSGTGRTEIAWYEIDPDSADPNGTNGPVQQGRIADLERFHFFPSIAVNAEGAAAVGFMGSSATEFASAWYSVRLPSDPPGAMRAPALLKRGEDSYFKTFGGFFNRWGDFGATAIDPDDDRSFWTLQEYARESEGECDDCDRWGTWWGRVSAAPCVLETDCADGIFCNGAEECRESVCVREPVCDDGDPCTTDDCDETLDACRNVVAEDGTSCTDHLYCNGEEACFDGACLPGDPPDCSGVNVCSVDVCAESFDSCGILPYYDGTSCVDDVFCNGAEQGCFGGICVPGPPPCNDGNPCTIDTCVESSRGCAREAVPDSEVPQGPDGICGTADDNVALFGRDRSCSAGRTTHTGDGLCDAADNCPGRFNPDQSDSDGDRLGDLCDPLPCQIGRVFVAANGGGRVTRFNLITGGRIVYASGLSRPTGVAIQPDGRALYFTQAGSGELSRLDLTTAVVTQIATNLPGLAGLRLDPTGTFAYATQAGAGRVLRVDLAKGTFLVVATELDDPRDLALSPDGGTLFVTEAGSGSVSSIVLDTGYRTRIATGLDRPIGIASTRDGAALLVVESAGRLTRLDRAGGAPQVAASGLGSPRYVVLLYDDRTAIVTTQAGGSLLKVDLVTGAVSMVATGLEVPEAITLDDAASVVRFPREMTSSTGGLVTVPLLSKGSRDLASRSIQFQVTFNPEVLKLLAVKPGTVTQGRKVVVGRKTTGRVTITLSGDAPITGTGSLALLEFRTIGAAGATTPLDLGQVLLEGGRRPDCTRSSHVTVSHMPPSGGVPDGFLIPGTPLTIAHAAADRIELTWGASCGDGDGDYAVYESGSPDMRDARPLTCTTGGARSMVLAPPEGIVFYLVVPRGSASEGSWGHRSDGAPRLQSPSACLPQSLSTCSPKEPYSREGF